MSPSWIGLAITLLLAWSVEYLLSLVVAAVVFIGGLTVLLTVDRLAAERLEANPDQEDIAFVHLKRIPWRDIVGFSPKGQKVVVMTEGRIYRFSMPRPEVAGALALVKVGIGERFAPPSITIRDFHPPSRSLRFAIIIGFALMPVGIFMLLAMAGSPIPTLLEFAGLILFYNSATRRASTDPTMLSPSFRKMMKVALLVFDASIPITFALLISNVSSFLSAASILIFIASIILLSFPLGLNWRQLFSNQIVS